jgi:hypothetical protein
LWIFLSPLVLVLNINDILSIETRLICKDH